MVKVRRRFRQAAGFRLVWSWRSCPSGRQVGSFISTSYPGRSECLGCRALRGLLRVFFCFLIHGPVSHPLAGVNPGGDTGTMSPPKDKIPRSRATMDPVFLFGRRRVVGRPKELRLGSTAHTVIGRSRCDVGLLSLFEAERLRPGPTNRERRSRAVVANPIQIDSRGHHDGLLGAVDPGPRTDQPRACVGRAKAWKWIAEEEVEVEVVEVVDDAKDPWSDPQVTVLDLNLHFFLNPSNFPRRSSLSLFTLFRLARFLWVLALLRSRQHDYQTVPGPQWHQAPDRLRSSGRHGLPALRL